ncbi:S-formylglutathione hydrolase [Myxococcota bacterium]|nr:S-formylglutathione hydrolase [Myxococcota bacterium]MCZ7618126.1 S-formylglutathione hydrolase [Myxococcota bacterium]
MKQTSSWASFDGKLAVYEHASDVCQCPMTFAVYTPPQASQGPVPVLWYLSGLTCNWSNVMEKSGIQRAAAEHGLMVIAPDTSPRGDDVADDDAYDLGQGAGFYLTATQAPWSKHYRMDQYILDELTPLVAERFPADMRRQGITGHSMGGHGALTLHLKHADRFRSVSAFSPCSSPSEAPWGQKAFGAYLGDDREAWKAYDAEHLVRAQPSKATILIDTGNADPFLDEQLMPQRFIDACEAAGQSVESRLQPGYDHSYYFIASLIDQHVAHHAQVLKSVPGSRF